MLGACDQPPDTVLAPWLHIYLQRRISTTARFWQPLTCISMLAPAVSRGTFSASANLLGGGDHPPDTFLAMPGFTKGLAFVNGFNLGWYWPSQGPQQTLYIPGEIMCATL